MLLNNTKLKQPGLDRPKIPADVVSRALPYRDRASRPAREMFRGLLKTSGDPRPAKRMVTGGAASCSESGFLRSMPSPSEWNAATRAQVFLAGRSRVFRRSLRGA